MSFDDLYAHFDEIQAMGYAVNLFTDYTRPGRWNQIWSR
jgi:hypothetical protein